MKKNKGFFIKFLSKTIKPKKIRYKTFKVGEGEYKTLLTEKFKNRKPYIPIDPKKIIAVIPGTICKIYVKEGDTIKEGSKLLILEAMKMKNEILLTNDKHGIKYVVKKIHISIGDNVTKYQLLIEFE